MGFTEWPRELIFQVLNDAAVGLHEKCSLARVNQCMHQLVLPLLYQSIQINIPEPKTGDGRKDAFHSLKNAVSENTDLPSLIQKLDVSWHCVQHGLSESYPEDHVVIEPDIERGINKILNLVPKIQTLVLQRVSRTRQGRPNYLLQDDWGGVYECPFLHSHQLNNWRELRLLGLSIGINAIALAMRLPKLQVLEIQRLAQNSEPIEEKHLGTRSTVRELHLGRFCKPHADMERLFQWPAGLETLSYDLGVYLGRRQPPDPPTLSRLLAPHTNTLVDIKLSGADNSVIHMDSINFRPFSKLKKLVIANKLLFPCHFGTHEEQAPYRNGVYKRLPPSLEHFEILFEQGTSALDPLYSPQCNFWIDEDYNWIEELGINRDEHLSSLRSFILTEHSACDWGFGPTDPSKLREWDMPTSVKDAFEGKGMQVKILIRTEYILRQYLGPKFVFRPSPRRDTPWTFSLRNE